LICRNDFTEEKAIERFQSLRRFAIQHGRNDNDVIDAVLTFSRLLDKDLKPYSKDKVVELVMAALSAAKVAETMDMRGNPNP
jgi:hypothetical protein